MDKVGRPCAASVLSEVFIARRRSSVGRTRRLRLGALTVPLIGAEDVPESYFLRSSDAEE